MILNDRFWSKVDKTDSCWNWTGGTNGKGYGQFGINGKTKSVHRLSYEYTKGMIPKDLQIDHLCRNTLCVNPDHLEAVTHQENVQRGLSGFVNGIRQRVKTHCPQGHSYSKENTKIRVYNNKPARHCKTCLRIKNREVSKILNN